MSDETKQEKKGFYLLHIDGAIRRMLPARWARASWESRGVEATVTALDVTPFRD
jgi:hypothetical protein